MCFSHTSHTISLYSCAVKRKVFQVFNSNMWSFQQPYTYDMSHIRPDPYLHEHVFILNHEWVGLNIARKWVRLTGLGAGVSSACHILTICCKERYERDRKKGLELLIRFCWGLWSNNHYLVLGISHHTSATENIRWCKICNNVSDINQYEKDTVRQTDKQTDGRWRWRESLGPLLICY